MLKQRYWARNSYYNQPLSLAIGSFDAIHYGHQSLLSKRFNSLESWVLYFYQDPQALHQHQFKGMVRSEAQRLKIFQDLGLDGAFRLDFSREISRMDGIDFIHALSQQLAIKELIVGEDFRLGKGATTTTQRLEQWTEEHNIHLNVVPLLGSQEQASKYSSSTLREAVESGNFEAIMQACGYPYAIDLRKLPHQKEGTMWHYALDRSEQVLPHDGVYSTIDGYEVIIKKKIVSTPAWLEQVLL